MGATRVEFGWAPFGEMNAEGAVETTRNGLDIRFLCHSMKKKKKKNNAVAMGRYHRWKDKDPSRSLVVSMCDDVYRRYTIVSMQSQGTGAV